MATRHSAEYRDRRLVQELSSRIRRLSRRPLRIMEVCGTHTVSIFRHGIRSLLPETITLLSGPGCPVCVTDTAEIDAAIELARRPGVVIATFGDLLRVPGSRSSLERERAAGREVRIVYSALDAVALARQTPGREVVLLGIGFETTAPTVAAAVLAARQAGLGNFSVLCLHKTVPPALAALTAAGDLRIDAFLLPGHVSVVIGRRAYLPFFERIRLPCAIAGFEPVDILQAVAALVAQAETERPQVENVYRRAVAEEGNPAAQRVLAAVFEPADARWRGIGVIPASGLEIREAYAAFDAARRFPLELAPAPEPRGCSCGEILTARKTPPECPLYGTRCTPSDPVGPCMVSSEGTCAAYFRYHDASAGG